MELVLITSPECSPLTSISPVAVLFAPLETVKVASSLTTPTSSLATGALAPVATGANAPVARDDVGVVNEDATLTVSNGANKTATGDIDVNGEHSGDVINTSSTTHYDTDADGDTLTVTAVRLGGTEGSGLILRCRLILLL